MAIDPNSWEAMMAVEGDTIALKLERTPDVRKSQPGRTFSSDAVLGLGDSVVRWIGSRMERYFRRTGQPALDMEVEIRVRINGEPFQTFSLPARFSVVDGKLRER